LGLRCRTCGRLVVMVGATLARRLAGFIERGDPTINAAISGDAPARPETRSDPPS
jgi:hypothetical protein